MAPCGRDQAANARGRPEPVRRRALDTFTQQAAGLPLARLSTRLRHVPAVVTHIGDPGRALPLCPLQSTAVSQTSCQVLPDSIGKGSHISARCASLHTANEPDQKGTSRMPHPGGAFAHIGNHSQADLPRQLDPGLVSARFVGTRSRLWVEVGKHPSAFSFSILV